MYQKPVTKTVYRLRTPRKSRRDLYVSEARDLDRIRIENPQKEQERLICIRSP